ncbi:MAG: DUF3540 domain-containing protein [Polyangiaceae bacterium]
MGTIVRIEGSTYVVRPDDDDALLPGPGHEIRAARAVSCLVEPELHDYVLVSGKPSGATFKPAYVLAVLERESPNVALSSSGDMEVRLREGRFRVASRKGIDLVSAESVDVVSSRFGVHAESAKIVATELVALASQAIGELTTVKVAGKIFDRVFERVSERVQRSFRKVEEIDQLTARQIDYAAEQTVSIKSENTVMIANELVKVDGEQIHFG